MGNDNSHPGHHALGALYVEEPSQDEAYQELELRRAMEEFRQDAELQVLVVGAAEITG